MQFPGHTSTACRCPRLDIREKAASKSHLNRTRSYSFVVASPRDDAESRKRNHDLDKQFREQPQPPLKYKSNPAWRTPFLANGAIFHTISGDDRNAHHLKFKFTLVSTDGQGLAAIKSCKNQCSGVPLLDKVPPSRR